MKKALKITGITLASLLGLVIIVAVTASTMVTSSGRLTKMVKKYAPNFITCDMQLGKADLTLFKTFPEVGLEIKNVALINPMSGSISDTLANIDNLIVVLDAKKLLKEHEIMVRKCILEDAFVNLYIDSLGKNNFDVFNQKEDEDTTSTSFGYMVDIKEIKLKNTALHYTDDRKQMTAQTQGLNLDLKGKMQDNDIDAVLSMKAGDLSLKMKAICLALKALNLDFDGEITQLDQINGALKIATPDISLNLNEPYLEHDTLRLTLPVQFSLKETKGHLDKAQIGLNRYLINVSGDAEVAKNGDVNLDLALNTNTLIVEDVLTYLPEKLQQKLSSIEYSGKLSLTNAEVKGTYNDSLMPLITVKVVTDNAKVNIPKRHYPFTEVNLDAFVDLDLNQDAGSVTVNDLKAKFNRSDLNINGVVDDLLGDVGLKFKVKGDVPMTDIKGFLPKTLKLNGRTDLNLTTNFTVKQLMKSLDDYNLNRLSAKANLKIKDFAFDMDTIHAASPLLNVDLALPNLSKGKGGRGLVSLGSQTIQAQVGKGINADLKSPDIHLFADNLKGGIEKMLLDVVLNFSRLNVCYDDITAKMETSAISFVTTPEKNTKGLKARITLDGKEIYANKGKDYVLNTNLLKIDASLNQNKNKSDFLNKWNPTADFMLSDAVVKIDGLGDDIRVSNIDFLFNSSKLDFKKSTFSIGQSDLSLQGTVVGVNEWMEDHKNLMKGEMLLTSDMLNINEIMDLTSGLGRSDVDKGQEQDQEDNPFMVPEGVDFSFVVRTKKSLYDNFDLNDLSGGLTVKDGTLILQEVGFTNKAAEMQLTAMYQSPRKNNLFLAMDFHLLDVQINDLLHMIPYIDTLVPMLKTFDGQGEFHIGAETNLKSNYEPKISTLRAAADIEGKNLIVKDQFAFTNITDKLKVSTNGEYKVDSLDVQLTVFKDEIDLWPSQIAIGQYKVTLDGRMTLDKNGEYHLSVTDTPIFLPNRMGLKLSGPINDLEYELEAPKFPTLYKPDKCNDTEQMYFELKKKIADRLKENLR